MENDLNKSNIDSLAVYIPMDRRLAISQGVELESDTYGTALSADISGFTSLTEVLALSLGPQRGAEELTNFLNRVYGALIKELHSYRGSVIGFSGDAITCWFDQDPGQSAAACAVAMQKSMDAFQDVELPGGSRTSISMKAALANGRAKRFIVGDPDRHITDVITGNLLDTLAEGENLAESGEILLDQRLINNIKGAVTLADRRAGKENGRVFGSLKSLDLEIEPRPWPEINPETLDSEKIRPWLLKPVFERLSRGQGEFLAELRPVVALFLRFSGIDYESDQEAGPKLDQFIRQVQAILAQFEGSLIQLTTGDKGSYLYAAFGAPTAHEDDPERASEAALLLRELKENLDFINSIQIGISQGRMRTGAYGARARRTYGVLGDDTNLSARLMSAAAPGQILVSERVSAALGDKFSLKVQPPIQLKGKSKPVNTFSLNTGLQVQKSQEFVTGSGSPLIGRKRELNSAHERVNQALNGHGQIIGIEGEAGIGKSRLAAEIIRICENNAIEGYASQCQSYGTNTSYQVWRKIWNAFFNLDPLPTIEDKIATLESQVAGVSSSLLPRLPLLSAVLNIHIPENSMTEAFDAKLRKSSLEAMLVDCLRHRAMQKPLYIVLEDCHWLDPLSQDLLEAVGRAVADLPVIIIIDYRPPEIDLGRGLNLNRLPYFSQISLPEFTDLETRQFIEARLERLLGGSGVIPAKAIHRITEKSGGNPFYIEELVNYLADKGINPLEESAFESLDLPASLHSLVLTRIDELTESQKTTIKVASVVGRTFTAEWLWSAFTQLEDETQTRSDLEELSRLDLTPLDTPEPELKYIFKNVITQEAAYESMPHTSRSNLHGQLGYFLEDCCLDEINLYIDLLAFHFEHSQDREKKRRYLVKAGEMAQANYANEPAIQYYKRALRDLPREDQLEVRLKLGDIYILTGDWREANRQIELAISLASELDDRRSLAWGQIKKSDLLAKQGQYFDASFWLDRALSIFREINDPVGAGQALHNAGTQSTYQGDFERAKDLFQQSLSIRIELGDDRNIANLLNNLGVVARLEDNQALAGELYDKALAIRRALGDKWAIAISLNNIGIIAHDQGDLESARRQLEEAVAIQKEIGDRFNTANALNNLANVARDEGKKDQALHYYQESLRIVHDLDAKLAIAYLFEDMGCLESQYGRPEHALRLISAAASMRGEIGAKLSQKEQERIDKVLSSARGALHEDEAQSAWSQGGNSSLTETIQFALDLNAE